MRLPELCMVSASSVGLLVGVRGFVTRTGRVGIPAVGGSVITSPQRTGRVCPAVARSTRWQPRQASKLLMSTSPPPEEKPTGHQPPGHQPPGHQPRGGGKAPQRSPEDEALAQALQEHQQNAPRLSKTEEVRNLMQYSTGFGTISTISQKLDGYPNGAIVGFGLDDSGRPLFAFSSMSSHTSDLKADGKAALTVTAATFKGAQDGRVTLIGDVALVPESEREAVKAAYKTKHPKAFWVDFGDFSWMRMNTIKAIRYVGGFAMAGDLTAEEYLSTKPDPITEFSAPIMNHMNADHSDTTRLMVEHYIVKGKAKVDAAEIVSVDRLGMYVVVDIKGEKGKLRLPFIREATSRKDVKDIIVQMTQEASASQS